jgi:type I restriction enzyme, S subunit
MRTVAVREICEFKYGSALPERSRIPGDVPVYGSNGRVGSHSMALTSGPTIIIGRKGSVGKVIYSPASCWPIDTAYYIDASSTDYNIRWLAYALDSLGLHELNKATGVPGLNRNDAYEKALVMPPLDEQRRIAAILDQADALRRKRVQAQAQLRTLLGSIFESHFSSAQTGAPSVRLDSVADIQVGYAFQSESYVEEGDGVRLCRGTNVLPGRLDWSDLAKWSNDASAPYDHLQLRTGDIVIAMDRPWISEGFKIAQVTSADLPALLVQRVARVRAGNAAMASFLFHLLQRPHFAHHCKPTETTVPHISPKEIRQYKIAVPSEAEVQSFAAKANLLSNCDQRQQEQSLKFEAIFASLQHRAFRGELTSRAAERELAEAS